MVFTPIYLIIWVLILFTSEPKYPVIFKQKRLGLKKKEFTIYKFKTMENEKITLLGKYLRKTGLDELPQLINIIRNEMSFVGPRPLTRYDVDRLMWNSLECDERWNVKPGITGLAQLTDVCNAELSLQKDIFYAKNKNMILDIKILLQSAIIPMFCKPKIKN